MSLEDQTPEVQPVEEEVVAEQVEEQAAAPADSKESADAAFEKGFNATQGIEEPEPEPQPEPAPQPAYDPEQVKELMEKVAALTQREAKVFGTMGALKQQIDALKAQPKPSQTALKLTADKFKRLSAEFPEMAQMFADDLNEALPGGAPSFDTAQIEQLVDQTVNSRLEQSSRAYEAKLLTVQHPDWKSVVASQEFAKWKETLPEDERKQLDDSWDAEFIGEKLRLHKDWKNKTVQQKQSNQRRLEAAITPRGSPQQPPAPSAEDAFIQGFKQARGR